MHQAVAVNADVHKRAEVGHVAHRAAKLHAGLQVLQIHHVAAHQHLRQLIARVAAGAGQFRRNVAQGRFTHIQLLRQRREPLRVRQGQQLADRLRRGERKVLQKGARRVVAFRVNACVLHQVLAAGNAQEACALLEGFGAKARHFLQLCAGRERSVFLAVRHDVLRDGRVDARDVTQQRHARRIHIHTDTVHTVLDHAAQRRVQFRCFQVMLILSYANRLRIDFDQLRQRILQPPRNRHRRTQADIKLRELLRRQLRRRIHRRARLADDHVFELFPQRQLLHHLDEELLCLAPRRAVADGDDADVMLLYHPLDGFLRLRNLAVAGQRENDARIQHAPGFVHNRDLAARADAGVKPHRDLPAHRRLHQQRAQIQREHANRRRARLVGQFRAQFRVQRRRNQPRIRIVARLRNVLARRTPRLLHEAVAHELLRLLLVHVQRDFEEALLLPAVHRQHPVRRHQAQRLTVVVVHAVGAVLVFRRDRRDHRRLMVVRFELRADGGIVADDLGDNIHRALQGILRRFEALLRVHIAQGDGFRRHHVPLLEHQRVRERLQSLLLGNGRAGTALRAVRAINILQLRQCRGSIEVALQLLRPDI